MPIAVPFCGRQSLFEAFTNSSCMTPRYIPGKTYHICSYPEHNEKEHHYLEALVVVWHNELPTGNTSLGH